MLRGYEVSARSRCKYLGSANDVAKGSSEGSVALGCRRAAMADDESSSSSSDDLNTYAMPVESARCGDGITGVLAK